MSLSKLTSSAILSCSRTKRRMKGIQTVTSMIQQREATTDFSSAHPFLVATGVGLLTTTEVAIQRPKASLDLNFRPNLRSYCAAKISIWVGTDSKVRLKKRTAKMTTMGTKDPSRRSFKTKSLLPTAPALRASLARPPLPFISCCLLAHFWS